MTFVVSAKVRTWRALAVSLLFISPGRLSGSQTFDVVVYGATPAGRQELSAALLEPTGRIGGMVTGGG